MIPCCWRKKGRNLAGETRIYDNIEMLNIKIIFIEL
jgi:hypothetical protein